MADYISKKFGLSKKIECFQAVYMNKNKLHVKEELEIRQLDQNQREVILEHYYKLSINEIDEFLKGGNLFGDYKDRILIGFIGNHLEGSMGLLKVFPKYRIWI